VKAEFDVSPITKLSSVLDCVMKSKPNNVNLKFFFSSPIVQQLWRGSGRSIDF